MWEDALYLRGGAVARRPSKLASPRLLPARAERVCIIPNVLWLQVKFRNAAINANHAFLRPSLDNLQGPQHTAEKRVSRYGNNTGGPNSLSGGSSTQRVLCKYGHHSLPGPQTSWLCSHPRLPSETGLGHAYFPASHESRELCCCWLGTSRFFNKTRSSPVQAAPMNASECHVSQPSQTHAERNRRSGQASRLGSQSSSGSEGVCSCLSFVYLRKLLVPRLRPHAYQPYSGHHHHHGCSSPCRFLSSHSCSRILLTTLIRRTHSQLSDLSSYITSPMARAPQPPFLLMLSAATTTPT